MNRSDYVSKSEAIVNTYDTVNKNPTSKLEDDTKTLMKKTLQNKIPDDYLRKILSQHSRTAEFYGLPKTHKPGNPLRPIVSACGDPLDKLSYCCRQTAWDPHFSRYFLNAWTKIHEIFAVNIWGPAPTFTI